ncbi:MAG: fumarylacetoacetate hydrolase family protein [Candidatus Handelsmanbacteria bacterium]|nr:fumarylacetoacetate hydrolase family protein [Candidatus Handelsmanbacteria bacterium]
MRIIRFVDEQGQTRLGEETSPGQAALLNGDLFGVLEKSGQTALVRKLLAPVVPPNILCIGLNYREHAAESGSKIPEYPMLFMKPSTALNNPGDPIRLPACQVDHEVDYECELAVVIGKPCRDVPEATALDYVLGYTAANDVSARTWQTKRGGGQFVRGKGFDTFCPLGPALVTADEIPNPQAIRLKTILNGQVMQDHTTGDMIFPVAQLISFLSQDTTLIPGTVILTGTPQGVGFARKPPVWLQPGDEVTIEMERIGKLTNPVAAAK